MWVNSSTESLSALPQSQSRWVDRQDLSHTVQPQSLEEPVLLLQALPLLMPCQTAVILILFFPDGLSYLLLHNQPSRLISLEHLFI